MIIAGAKFSTNESQELQIVDATGYEGDKYAILAELLKYHYTLPMPNKNQTSYGDGNSKIVWKLI